MSNQQRWDAWLWTCVMALLPLGLWFLIHWLTGDSTHAAGPVARELLFFALSTCGLSLTEVHPLARDAARTNGTIAVKCSFVLMIGVAVLYGAFLAGEIRHDAVIVQNAYRVSIVVAVVAAGLTNWIQVHRQQEATYVAR